MKACIMIAFSLYYCNIIVASNVHQNGHNPAYMSIIIFIVLALYGKHFTGIRTKNMRIIFAETAKLKKFRKEWKHVE